MIWHFFEVWIMLAVAFATGCSLGAYLYGALADSRMSLVQGAVADGVGDGLDRMKAALGLGPAWRREHLRAIERPLPAPHAPDPEEEEFDDVDDAYVSKVALPPPVRREEPRRIEREERRALPPRQSEPEPAPEPEEESKPDTGDPERIAATGVVADDGVVPRRPPGLSGPRGGVPDNLTRIRGVGERNEALLNALGVYHFGQIASWTPGEARWIGQYLAFPERIERDDWVGQAMVFATGGDTGFEKSADRRRRRRQERRMAQDHMPVSGRVEPRSPRADVDSSEDDEPRD